MITKELKDQGISCRGQGFSCPNCKDKDTCIDFVNKGIGVDKNSNENEKDDSFCIHGVRKCYLCNTKNNEKDTLITLLESLIIHQAHYITLLEDELNDTVSIANVHGWKSNRYEQGKQARNSISRAKDGIKEYKDIIKRSV